MIRLEYNPDWEYPFHFANSKDKPNTFGWVTLKESISEDIASDFTAYALRNLLHKKLSHIQMKDELNNWIFLNN